MAPFSDMEIQTALFDIHNDKSPGLDGFPASFFKYYWSSVGSQIIRAVNRFFENGHMLKEWNQSLLILIPKQDPPEEVNHLRPICLCNVVYKCISKCMVNRMKPLLPKLIDHYQNAFILGSQMDDSKLLFHETLHIINKQRSGSRYLAALELDMNKAYDRVSWLFLLKVLKAYGFPDIWINLIQQCISTVSYRILINGGASKHFSPQCGLRQGDPLSPYLFLFCMDIFSRMTHWQWIFVAFKESSYVSKVLLFPTFSLQMTRSSFSKPQRRHAPA